MLHSQGCQLRLGEGLSCGQRQTVGMARAQITDPPMLVCDEPTGAMDPTAERLVLVTHTP